ncbi:MAG: bacterioferritin [Ruminococcaceae bacterium]|nr:bacterioferritin [Oscillospiraceae bacterium]
MKGNEDLIKTLNNLLADELTAINQYIVHGEINASNGYEKLHKHSEKQAIDEMKHAEKLIERILFLEGRPIVSKLNPLNIAMEVPEQVKNDLALEMGAVASYNKAIKLAGDVLDFATRDLLEGILQDEDRHLDDLEELRDQIEQLGLQIFLSTQM